VGSFRCPFHGWRWDLEGNLAEVPADWDFPQIREHPERSCLPEAAVATWQGFVFVNLDPEPIPFEQYADKLIEHFGSDFAMADRYVVFHAVKEIPANWKVCMEAFSEAYHVIATHPQILEYCADTNSEYSVWPDSPYVTRFVNSFGVGSPHMSGITEQQVADAQIQFSSRAPKGSVTIPEGTAARPIMADVMRTAMSERMGIDLDETSDAEVLDAILYHLFPAFAPWAGVGQSLVYRWRPGSTPDTCFMDVMRTAPVPAGQPRPERAETQRLTLDQAWSEATGMGGLSAVFEQDMANLPRVQQGLKSRGAQGVSFGLYQEARLRGFHRLIDRFVAEGLEAQGRNLSELRPFMVPPG
ncbi:MAG: SRPBCC family protein, partial [Ilumatobacteraceae bacterium]